MITAKFGGTAITPRNLVQLKRILTPHHSCIVVSAVGKEFFGDTKTTDLLTEYFSTHSQSVWEQIADKYRRLVEVNGISVDIDSLLNDAQNRALQYDVQYCMSLGEELSAKVVAAFLNCGYVEAEQTVRFSNKELNVVQTYNSIRRAFEGVNLAVVGGFYGGSSSGRVTFSRGGSDVTGAIFAAALNSSLYENWTDASGVCVANPTRVHGVATVDSMSYGEMRLLSLAGAEVLHPDAVAPVEALGIPIKIGNYLNPTGASTLISACPSRNRLLSIAEKILDDGKVLTTVLHSYSYWQIAQQIAQFLRVNTTEIRFFDAAREVNTLGVYGVNFCSNTVHITTDRSILSNLYKSLVDNGNA